jgi:pilus assembly protein CpaC
MSDKVRTSVSKVPLLGSIPILGALFSSNQFQRQESELLVVITARLVKPVAPHEAPRLPTDYDGAAPSAFGFFLMSQEGGGPPDGEPPPPARGPSGNAGFSR